MDYLIAKVTTVVIAFYFEGGIDQVCAQGCALGIPMGIVGKVQLLCFLGKGCKQVHIAYLHLRQQAMESFCIGACGFYAIIRHIPAVQGIFIGCNNKGKFLTVFVAVLLHQRHIAGGAEQLPGGHGICIGIIGQGLFKE